MKLTLACERVIADSQQSWLRRVSDLPMQSFSGLPDMIELLRLNVVSIFTCANDYADVKVRHHEFTPASAKSSVIRLRLQLSDSSSSYPLRHLLRAR
jgi:hypothetical protein